MTQKNQIWKCEICGNIIEVLHEGADSLVCCGQPMKLLKENTVDASLEKHVPVLESKGKGKTIVKVGAVAHPMTEEHYIEWVEVVCNLGVFKYFLKPGDKPEVCFYLGDIKDFTVRAYCNLHGLWKSQ
ncbi:MAG: desulfoferrodoxin [Candidatus Nanoarchaeia archaeon]|nr:desulfoferrodoxin [Candidatus Nanoarchaeia archaeon]MDD5741350.1 desulfoferrodoxin [Candidatus Nanoarchaeia archaeon]